MNKLIHVDTHEFKATLESKVLSLSPSFPLSISSYSLSLSLPLTSCIHTHCDPPHTLCLMPTAHSYIHTHTHTPCLPPRKPYIPSSMHLATSVNDWSHHPRDLKRQKNTIWTSVGSLKRAQSNLHQEREFKCASQVATEAECLPGVSTMYA